MAKPQILHAVGVGAAVARRSLGVILLIVGGWPYLLWGIFLRTGLGLHSTWLVNSATHMSESRRYPIGDTSRNSF